MKKRDEAGMWVDVGFGSVLCAILELAGEGAGEGAEEGMGMGWGWVGVGWLGSSRWGCAWGGDGDKTEVRRGSSRVLPPPRSTPPRRPSPTCWGGYRAWSRREASAPCGGATASTCSRLLPSMPSSSPYSSRWGMRGLLPQLKPKPLPHPKTPGPCSRHTLTLQTPGLFPAWVLCRRVADFSLLLSPLPVQELLLWNTWVPALPGASPRWFPGRGHLPDPHQPHGGKRTSAPQVRKRCVN